jgi:hypothetical protein
MRLFAAICLITLAVPVSGAAQSTPAGNAATSQQRQITDADRAIGFYAPGLVELGKPARPGGEGFLTPTLATGASVTKDGYTFTMASSEGPVTTSKKACNDVPLVRGYYVTATPVKGSGGQYFGTNTKGVIYHGNSPLKMTDQSADGTPIK